MSPLQVNSDERHFVDPDAGTLDVFNTSVLEDSGFYTCLVWNEVGTAQHTVQVQITDIRSEHVISSWLTCSACLLT